MVRTNGLHPQDPDYNDYGFSDFEADYIPEDHQLEELLEEHPEKVLKLLNETHKPAVWNLQGLWKDLYEDEIEKEWDGRGDND